MRQYIELKNASARREIAEAFKVSLAYVSMSLNFKRQGDTSKKICEMAKNKGGKLVEVKEVEMTTRTTKVLNTKGEIIKTIQ